MMNTRERRAYLDRMRKDQCASLCPRCGFKTRHMAIPSEKEPGTVDVVCEYCRTYVVRSSKDYEPWKFVRIPAKV